MTKVFNDKAMTNITSPKYKLSFSLLLDKPKVCVIGGLMSIFWSLTIINFTLGGLILIPILFLAFGFFCNPILGVATITVFRGLFTYTSIEIGSLIVSFEGLINFFFLLCGIFYLLTKKISPLRGPSSMPFLLLILFSSLGIVYSPDCIEFLKKISRLGSYYILYLIIIEITRTRKGIKWMAYALFLVMIPPGILGIIQTIETFILTHFDAVPPKGFVQSFMTKNSFGFFLSFSLLYSLSFYLHLNNLLKKHILLVLISILTFLLILTTARASWVSFLAGLLMFILIYFKKPGKIVVPILLVFLLTIGFMPIIFEAISKVIYPTPGVLTSWTFRTKVIWPSAWRAFISSPIYGSGLGSTLEVIQPAEWGGRVLGQFNAHNDYLIVLVETGLIGFCLYAWIMYSFIKTLLEWKNKVSDTLGCSLCLGAIAIFVAYTIGGIAEHLLQSPGPGGYFFTTVAVAHGVISNQHRLRPFYVET